MAGDDECTVGDEPEQAPLVDGGLLLGLFLSSTEQSVVATALPTMAGELGGANRIAWVVSACLLTSTIVTPLYGKMSDLYGRRIVYQVAIVVFLFGSTLCALFTLSAITGPLWGGLLVDGPGWRWVFWSVVPIGFVVLLVTNRGLRLPFATTDRPVDRLGIVLLVIASTGLILVPIWGGETYPWASWQLAIPAFVGLGGTALFVWQERRAVEPIIPLRLFRDRTIVAVFVMGFALMGALLTVTTFMPLFLQVTTGVSATRSGLLLTPQSIGISLVATVSGLVVTKTGRYKWTLVTGASLSVVALLALTRIGPDTGALDLAPVLLLLGIGLGLIFPNLTLSVQNAAPMEDLGIGTSTSNFFRSMGGAFGAAISGALLTKRLDQELLDRLGADRLDEVGGASGLIRTPRIVKELPSDLRTAVVESVGESVVGVIWLAIPLMVLVLFLATTVRETPLRTTSTIGGESESESSSRSRPAPRSSAAPVDG